MIYEQHTYVQVDDDGKENFIIARRPAGNIEYEDWAKAKDVETFSATGVLPININGQQAQANFKFEVPGNTIDEAFANLPAAMEQAGKKAIADLNAQARQQAILSAASDPAAGQILKRMNGSR